MLNTQICPVGQVAYPVVVNVPKAGPVLPAAPATARGPSTSKPLRGPSRAALARAFRQHPRHLSAASVKVARRPTARAAMVNQLGAWYGYAFQQMYGNVPAGTAGMFWTQSQEDPVPNPADAAIAHSLAQAWLIDPSGWPNYSDFEYGWIVSQQVYGDTLPHLFVFHFDGGVAHGGYNSDFIPYPGSPALTDPLGHNDNIIRT